MGEKIETKIDDLYVVEFDMDYFQTIRKGGHCYPIHIHQVEDMIKENLNSMIRAHRSAWLPLGVFKTIEEANKLARQVKKAFKIESLEDIADRIEKEKLGCRLE